jgi:hypothetical protein
VILILVLLEQSLRLRSYFDDYQEPNTWEEKFSQTVDSFNRAVGVKEANQLKKEIGILNEEAEVVTDEVIATMSQLITSCIQMHERELYEPIIFREVEN